MIDNVLLLSIITRLEGINDKYKQPLSIESLNDIKALCLPNTIPEEFIFLNKLCRVDFFRFFDFFNFEIKNGVIGETLYYREKHNLPPHYIVLFCDDVSFVVLNVESGKSEVIWCDYQDFFNLCDNLPMQYNPTIFPTFADFYEFLLDEEEKMREEEKTLSN